MIFIEGNVPSSKNSRINTSKGSFMSKTVMKYLRQHGIQGYSSSKKEVRGYKTRDITFPVDELRDLFSGFDYPIEVGFHFVRDSKRRFDFHNAVQIIFDLMTAFDIIEDDDMNCVIPTCIWIDDKPYTVDKNNPGVWITVKKRK